MLRVEETPTVLFNKSFRSLTCLSSISAREIESTDPITSDKGTGYFAEITTVSSTTLGAYFFAVGAYHYTPRYNFYANFGNGYFGTTAVSSAGTNASGFGIFEYDVPTGFTAWSTKGLNE